MFYFYVQGNKIRLRVSIRVRVFSVFYFYVQGHKIRLRVSIRVRVFSVFISTSRVTQFGLGLALGLGLGFQYVLDSGLVA